MKMVYRRSIIILFSLLMVIVLIPGAMAEKPGGGYGKRGKYGKHEKKINSAARILKQGDALHLSDQQRRDLGAMSLDFKMKKIRLKADIEIAKLEMGSLLHTENPSEDKIFAKVEEIGKMKTDLKKEKIRVKLAVRKVLTKEQGSQLHKQMSIAATHRKGKLGSPHKTIQGPPK